MQKYLFIFLVCLFSGLPLFSQNNDKDTKNSKEKTSKERTFKVLSMGPKRLVLTLAIHNYYVLTLLRSVTYC